MNFCGVGHAQTRLGHFREVGMRSLGAIPSVGVFLLISQSGLPAQTLSRDYPVKPVPFTAVHFNDTFWLPRIETNRKVTIPFALDRKSTRLNSSHLVISYA